MFQDEVVAPEVPFVVPTLMYHRVVPALDCKYCVWPEIFENQIRLVAEYYETLTASEALARLEVGDDPGHRSLVLTFDDGYEDFYLYAFPILREHGVKATLFLPTEHIGGTNLWNPKADYVCKHLSWPQVGRMVEWGIEIGGHSKQHHSLVKFDQASVEDEVAGSATAIEREIGFRPRVFAYPFGVFNALVQRSVEAHYELAFSVTDGVFDWREDRYAINRIFVSNNSTEYFKAGLQDLYGFP